MKRPGAIRRVGFGLMLAGGLAISASAWAVGSPPGLTPEQAQQLTDATNAYVACLKKAVRVLAKSKEAADVVADGTIGACQSEDAAMAAVLSGVLPPANVNSLMGRARAQFRDRLIAMVIELRAGAQ